jgi:hypothetical protein
MNAEPVAATSTPDPVRANRRVKRRAGRPGLWSALVVLFIPHVWVGIGLVGLAIGQLAFPLVAEPVTGHVLSKEQHVVKGSPTWNVRITYALHGEPGELYRRVSEAEYQHIAKGDAVELKAACILGLQHASPADAPNIPVMLLFALFWNSIVGMFVYSMALRPILNRWLVRHGASAAGTITRIDPPAKGTCKVFYSFVPEGAGVHVEGTCTINTSIADTLRKGMPVTIFHLAARPMFSVVYEASAWELA